MLVFASKDNMYNTRILMDTLLVGVSYWMLIDQLIWDDTVSLLLQLIFLNWFDYAGKIFKACNSSFQVNLVVTNYPL